MANEDKIVFPNGRRLNEFALSGASGTGDFKADGSVPATGNWNLNGNMFTGINYLEGASGATSLRLFYPHDAGTAQVIMAASRTVFNWDMHVGANSGFLRDNSGDMEIHLATGKKLKIVVG